MVNQEYHIGMAEKSILELINATHRLLERLESSPRDYGTGDLLFSSDIHTVFEVHRQPGCSLTALAERLQVSKPAASKFAKKMLALGYLLKEHLEGNRKEVAFSLTIKGEAAIKAHADFERRAFAPLRRIEKELSPRERELIRDFLGELIAACPWR